MKRILPFIALSLTLSFTGFAQTNIQLNIHHKLADVDFAMGMGAKNNLDHDFNVSRLEYYISQISIIHDGGIETTMDDVYVLVDAAEATEIDLGSHDITAVEGVNFYIGVDPDQNHLDPSTFPSGHALAPQSPSMHWGWAAGYRFIAIEGYGSSNYNQLYQLHGLGDNNYFQNVIALSETAVDNAITINLDGDYTAILNGVQVNNGVIVHGDYGDAKRALENCRDLVFSPSATVSSTIDFSEVNRFDVFPNPVTEGVATLVVDATKDLSYEVMVSDILGRQIQHFDSVNSNETIELRLRNAGLYTVSLIKEGQAVITKKLMVK